MCGIYTKVMPGHRLIGPVIVTVSPKPFLSLHVTKYKKVTDKYCYLLLKLFCFLRAAIQKLHTVTF